MRISWGAEGIACIEIPKRTCRIIQRLLTVPVVTTIRISESHLHLYIICRSELGVWGDCRPFKFSSGCTSSPTRSHRSFPSSISSTLSHLRSIPNRIFPFALRYDAKVPNGSFDLRILPPSLIKLITWQRLQPPNEVKNIPPILRFFQVSSA